MIECDCWYDTDNDDDDDDDDNLHCSDNIDIRAIIICISQQR